ncbi:MAG: hypothetical protein JWP89_2544 [Schlesneria sp.]|nr:hypothetical protein [Schlesneria sp.]
MNRCSRNNSNRRGITRVDVIVVLGLGLLLFLLFAPAVRSARRPARKLQCLNNMRNVALAMQNYASSQSGKLPFLSSVKAIKNSAEEEGDFIEGWPVTLLPALDSTTLLKAIRKNAVIKSGQATIGDGERVWLDVFTCPEDGDSHRNSGGLSYVVNSGFISRSLYHGDPDRKHIPGSLAWIGEPGDDQAIAVHVSTGVFWQQNEAFGPSLEYISTGDGSSTTLMVTENLQAGNWYDTDTAKISFGFPVENSNGKVPLGVGQTFESEERPLNTEFKEGTLMTAKGQDWRVNAGLKAQPGTLPRPSSNHAGGVNVIMCDGSGRFLNQNIDPFVYLKLLTANGIPYGEGELQQSSY